MNYISSTEEQRREMLKKLGINNARELFSCIPEELRLKDALNIPQGMCERDLIRKMEGIAAENRVYDSIFRGAGAYNHFIPSIVNSVVTKEEFVTAYTPYQAEMSQGVLQSIFEYQTMICSLTGMDVSNASLYDGASAAAEAAAMCREKNRRRILVSAAAHPDTIAVMKTYAFASGDGIELIPQKDGATDIAALKAMLSDGVSCVYIAQPNYYGIIEDTVAAGEAAHAAGARFVMGCNPISLAIMPSAAEDGADIAVGEGQPLGMPLSFGGPYLGFMACKKELVRRMPGRIVGETTDSNGRRAFVLTLQAREQHIKREKALSNICSNQALCALTAAVYLSALGSAGLREAAELCCSGAHYMAEALQATGKFTVKPGEFFHEFVTVSDLPSADIIAALDKVGILGGLPLSENEILWCVTEMNTKADIDRLVGIIGGLSD